MDHEENDFEMYVVGWKDVQLLGQLLIVVGDSLTRLSSLMSSFDNDRSRYLSLDKHDGNGFD